MNFAIIEDGGRQYKVSIGDELAIDLRPDVTQGDAVRFERVLLTSSEGNQRLGFPLIEGAAVNAVIVEGEVKGPKLEIQKFRRRKNYRRHTGHRQKHTVVRIESISIV